MTDVPRPAARSGGFYLALLWLIGGQLRLTILAVPPVLPLIHRDLGLSEKAVGVLSSLPVLLLALAAVPGSLMVARLGARRGCILGLAIVAIAGAARGLGPSAPMLYGMTFAMGIGVALCSRRCPRWSANGFPRTPVSRPRPKPTAWSFLAKRRRRRSRSRWCCRWSAAAGAGAWRSGRSRSR
jgi:cyanate permease